MLGRVYLPYHQIAVGALHEIANAGLISLDISRTAATSLLTCGDGGEGPHLLVIALVEGSALIVAGQQWYWVPFDNFVRLLMKYRG
jgi:hypothetical protein